jgi:Mn2+/Fe2+ NRAMP family transporter
MLWTVIFTYPLMAAVQAICARIGRVTGRGLASNMAEVMPRPLISLFIALLFIANAVNIGADLAAMGAAAELLAGRGQALFSILFAIGSLLLQVFIPYHRYVVFLKWMTLALFAYVGVVFSVHIDWADVARFIFRPEISWTRDAVLIVVAVFGTTISPYLFFWQASQEVEEMRRRRHQRPLKDMPRGGAGETRRIITDTSVGMVFSNSIAFFIMVTTAATLHASGVTTIETAADAANALRPIAGDFAFLLFAMGIIGTGLLAIPVLAGSAAYAVAELYEWPSSLEAKVPRAVGFYAIIAASTLIGFGLTFTPLDPIRMLIWSAIINGVVAVPIMAMMMLIVTHKDAMGRFRARRPLAIAGWGATGLMAITVAAMVISMAL